MKSEYIATIILGRKHVDSCSERNTGDLARPVEKLAIDTVAERGDGRQHGGLEVFGLRKTVQVVISHVVF